jgi:hypothetical protein
MVFAHTVSMYLVFFFYKGFPPSPFRSRKWLYLVNYHEKYSHAHGFHFTGHHSGSRAHLTAHIAGSSRFYIIYDRAFAAEFLNLTENILPAHCFSAHQFLLQIKYFQVKIDINHSR